MCKSASPLKIDGDAFALPVAIACGLKARRTALLYGADEIGLFLSAAFRGLGQGALRFRRQHLLGNFAEIGGLFGFG